MATVKDASGNGGGNFGANWTDPKLCTPNRTNAGAPTGLTPQYASEIVHDSTNFLDWRAYGTAAGEFRPLVMDE